MTEPVAVPDPAGRGRHQAREWAWTLLSLVACFAALAVVASVMPEPEPVDESVSPGGPGAYLLVFLLMVGDAVVPILPGETTLNVASTMAANGALDLRWVMMVSAAGTVLGDSALYAISRRYRDRVQRRLDAALANEKVVKAMGIIGTGAPTLLVLGRYVPAGRFVVNATLGLRSHPYALFLRWSAVGGVAWSTYCCVVAYLVGTALGGFPLASVLLAGLASSLAIAIVFVFVLRRWRAQEG